jgi:hypothetical protein
MNTAHFKPPPGFDQITQYVGILAAHHTSL